MDYNKLHKELTFRTSRSSGSGGQHVNKVATKVELLFDVLNSRVLNEEEKDKILKNLSNRINKGGLLTVTSEKSRSQLLNKNATIKKFEKLVHQAITHEEIQRDAGAFRANKKKRLHSKKHLSNKKAMRKKVSPDSRNDLF